MKQWTFGYFCGAWTSCSVDFKSRNPWRKNEVNLAVKIVGCYEKNRSADNSSICFCWGRKKVWREKNCWRKTLYFWLIRQSKCSHSKSFLTPPQCHPYQEIRRPHCRGFLRKSLSGSYSLSKAIPFLLQCPVSASRIPSMMSHCWCKCSSLRPLSPVSKWVTWGLTRVENFPEIVNPWYGIYIYIML